MIKGSPLAGKVSWGNDEADPKVGWSHTYPWRADARYAAMVPKVRVCVRERERERERESHRE